MPLYEYRCEECHAAFVALQPVNAPRTGAKCPHCGSTQTRRVLSTFSSRSAAPGAGSRSGSSCFPGG